MENQDIIKGYNLLSKQVVNDVVEAAVQAIKEGKINPLNAMVQCAGFENISKQIKKAIGDMVEKEFDNYPTQTVEVGTNATITISERVTYDYSVSPEWNNIQEEKKELGKRQESLEEILKLAAPDRIVKDATNTEIWGCKPKRTRVFTVKFK